MAIEKDRFGIAKVVRDHLGQINFNLIPDTKLTNPTGKLTKQEIALVGQVGFDIPGSNQHRRELASNARSILSQPGRFADIPSSGGFTILGLNVFGEDVARDNTTGQVGTVSSLTPVSPTARAIGKSKTPAALARKGDPRRSRGERTGTRAGKSQPKQSAKLGAETILGSQSILG